MSYAIQNNGLGWRSVSGPQDVGVDETYSETQPVLEPQPPTPLEQIRALEAEHADAQARVTRQSLLPLALEKAMATPEALALTAGMEPTAAKAAVHTFLMSQDNGYAALFTLEQQVEALRAQIP